MFRLFIVMIMLELVYFLFMVLIILLVVCYDDVSAFPFYLLVYVVWTRFLLLLYLYSWYVCVVFVCVFVVV